MTEIGLWGVPLAMVAGAIRVSTPYLFVSLGECLTERAGRVNIGQEGILVFGAMSAYAISYKTGSPWAGVAIAGVVGMLLGFLHGVVSSLPRVNDFAVGIAIMLLGSGLAFFLGKPFIAPTATGLPYLDFGAWSTLPPLHEALRINVLFIVGIALALALHFFLRNTRWGLVVRSVGDSSDAAHALGYSVNRVRILATAAGGFIGGIGGAFLSLAYPGSWNEGLSSGQGLMAVALVIFARWRPLRCLGASLLFGAASALGPALQSVGFTQTYYLFNAAPYFLTLALLLMSSARDRALEGAPRELSISR